MRFVHTGDWHLGRVMHGVHLIEDQSVLLDQIAEIIADAGAAALLVTGDVYDRAVPPADAVMVLNRFLSKVVVDLGVPVIMIAGNHDSPHRLEFGARVLATRGLHVVGCCGAEPAGITLEDEYGPVHFYALPYSDPPSVRESLARKDLVDHDAATRALIDLVRLKHPKGERSVVMAHAFVAGGVEAESERPLSVGGADRVGVEAFDGFHYVALGHLHRPQSVGTACVSYPGSLFWYGFSEADHGKTVNLVDMDAAGTCVVQRIPLTPRRRVRRIEGFLKDILQGPAPTEGREDYLLVTLLDRGPILDVMSRLREVYPNVLHVERPALEPSGKTPAGAADHRRIDDVDVFVEFFSQVTGRDISEEERQAYVSVVDELRRSEREPASTFL